MSASTPLITDPLEAISKWLPPEATCVSANAHTWRMLKARTGNAIIDVEMGTEARKSGFYGYAWGLGLWVDVGLPDGTFSYGYPTNSSEGSVSIQGVTYQRDPGGESYYGFNPRGGE